MNIRYLSELSESEYNYISDTVTNVNAMFLRHRDRYRLSFCNGYNFSVNRDYTGIIYIIRNYKGEIEYKLGSKSYKRLDKLMIKLIKNLLGSKL